MTTPDPIDAYFIDTEPPPAVLARWRWNAYVNAAFLSFVVFLIGGLVLLALIAGGAA